MKRAHTRITDNTRTPLQIARGVHDDYEATRYMDRLVKQAVAQIQRPSRQAVETVRVRFTQRLLEAIK
jgi:hypothetical protein